MNKKIVFWICLYLLPGIIQAEKILELDMVIPGFPIFAQNSRYILISSWKDGKNYIYDRNTGKQILHFGKIGEGPGEFIRSIRHVMLNEDTIFILSQGRLSTFDLEGKHIADKRSNQAVQLFCPIGNHFLAQKQSFDDKDWNAYTFSPQLLDFNLKEIKTFSTYHGPLSPIKERIIDPFFPYILTSCDTKHILIADPRGAGCISIYDIDGIPLHTIHYPFEKIPITPSKAAEIREKQFQWIKKEADLNKIITKLNIIIPSHYPPFSMVWIDRSTILVNTYRDILDHTEFLCFNLKGEYLGKINHPKDEWGTPYEGHFYRMIENEETENFELHRWPIGKPQK